MWTQIKNLLHKRSKPTHPLTLGSQKQAHGKRWIVVRYLGEGTYLAVDADTPPPTPVKLIQTEKPRGCS